MSFIYTKAKNRFATGGFNWTQGTSQNFRAMFVTAAYTPDQDVHEFLAAVPTTARKGNNNNTGMTNGKLLTPKTPASGVLSVNTIVQFTGIPNGVAIKYVLIYKDGVTDADAPLLCLIDSGFGLPFTTNGGDLYLSFGTDSATEIVRAVLKL